MFAEQNTSCIHNICLSLGNIVVNLFKMFSMPLDRYSFSITSNLYILSFHRKSCEFIFHIHLFLSILDFTNSSNLSSSPDILISSWSIPLIRLYMKRCIWLCFITFQIFQLNFLQYFCHYFINSALILKFCFYYFYIFSSLFSCLYSEAFSFLIFFEHIIIGIILLSSLSRISSNLLTYWMSLL